MIKAIMLDFYGTLVEEDDLYIEQICEDILSNTISDIEKYDIGKYWYNRFLTICNESFGDKFVLQRDIETQALKDTIKHFNSKSNVEKLTEILFSYWSDPQPFNNTSYVLNALSLKACVVSNIDNKDLNSALSSIHWTPDYIVTSESEKAYKPRAEMFEKALELIAVLPSEVIHIGDSYSSDIVGSNTLGIPNIWLNPKKRLINGDIHPDYEVDDIINILPIIESLK